MRIGFVEPHLRLFGGIRRIVELSNRLVGRGLSVTIYHPTGEPCEWMECLCEIAPSARLLEREHDALIYNDPNPYDFELVRSAHAALKVFYVLELYETELLTGFHPSLWRPRNQRTLYMKRSLRAPYLKLANASWLRDWLRERMGIEAELLLGGVNRAMFHPVDGPRPAGPPRLLCSGDPRPRKGTAAIHRAVELVRRELPELVLESYHGKGIPQSRMAQTYAAADLFVEASHQAGWNNPVAEAMACGVPVVCTDIGGVRDFAFHERTALLVPPGDAEALAAAILRLARDPALRRRLAAAALEHIGRFDWDESAARLHGMLASRLAGARAARV